MGKRTRAIAVAAVIGLGGLGVVVANPALAASVSGGSDSAVSQRVTAIRDALKGLVDDDTLTDAQADKVAETLAESDSLRGPGMHKGGFGRFGGGESLTAAATALGLSEDDVRTALREGTTLKELAEKQGKDVDDVVTAIVAAAKADLDQAVKDGKLTQERADAIAENLSTRVQQFVENGRPARGGMGGGMGRGGHGPWGDGHGPWGGDDDSSSPSPSASPSTSGAVYSA